MSRARDLADSADKDIAGTLTLDGLTVDGNVGIGTSSPSETLTVAQGTTGRAIAICSSDANVGGFIGASGDAGSANKLIINGSRGSGAIIFQTVSDEKMRIDSSGNLLVGGTDINPYDNTSGAGIALRSTGAIYNAIDGGVALILNRMTNEGTIAQFRQGGSTVGSIGVADSGDRIYLAGGGLEGVGIDNSANAFVPTSEAGAFKDNHLSLGTSSARFENLYLSGGAYIGGTGSANYLDDYEEGTWTPSFSGLSNTPTYVLLVGRYTKIGRFVSVHMTMQTSQSPTFTDNNSELQITGLPFAIDGGTYASGLGAVGSQGFSFNGSNNDGNITGQLASAVNSSEHMFFFVTSSGSNRARVKNVGITNGAIIETTICYTAT